MVVVSLLIYTESPQTELWGGTQNRNVMYQNNGFHFATQGAVYKLMKAMWSTTEIIMEKFVANEISWANLN